MSESFAYAVVTNEALIRFQAGGIISHIISQSRLALVGARMYAPSAGMVKEYARIVSQGHSEDGELSTLLESYVSKSFAPSNEEKKRILFLLFKGEDAVKKLCDVCEFTYGVCRIASVRNIYGNLVSLENGQSYFEPVILFPCTKEANNMALRLFGKHYDSDGGILTGIEKYPEGVLPELTLAMIKPDNFRFPNTRPGGVLNFFCGTGLNLVGIKVQRMSTAQAMEFYGPVKEVFKRIYAEKSAQPHFGENSTPSTPGEDSETDTPDFKFDKIIRYMSGRSESECPAGELKSEGTVTSVVLIFEGPDAIKKIRTVLGSTNPSKASTGTIRREFGSSITENSAHASDSPESVRREMDILIYHARDYLKDILTSEV